MSDARADFRASGYAAINEPANEWADEQPAPAEGPQAPELAELRGAALMATSSGYADWIAAGRPWTTAQPIAELTKVLRGYGYTVYVIGNDSHARANPPEDHMPYSATGWPVTSPRWFVHSLDIMPPAAGSGLPDLGRLAQQLIADKDAGVAPWIKYMNVTLPGQPCQHISWQPNKAVTSSSDTGHIHLSIRADATHSATGGYDPIARIRGGAPTPPAPKPKPAAPAFPLVYPPNYFGDIKGDKYSHGGFYGSEKVWIRQIQQRLAALGFYRGVVDGEFGPLTIAAAKAFQQKRRLLVDGKVGPATWGALFS